MIYSAMKILTTLFLAFAMCSFLHFAYKKRKDIHNLVGDIISAVFLAWAIYFMWG